jgi:hypothetical protein
MPLSIDAGAAAPSSDRAAGAPAEEIEVTPAMIEAGRSAAEQFYLGDNRYGLSDEFFTAIFLAMRCAVL